MKTLIVKVKIRCSDQEEYCTGCRFKDAKIGGELHGKAFCILFNNVELMPHNRGGFIRAEACVENQLHPEKKDQYDY